ncbi:rod-binding protein [Ruminiclostridium josui]|uniref:rod-binding protein n=1 Tax=Ruminiclostridium josui TaxID=1499 RepID=UPI000463C440|nr:rod-binding protein [Ruminiclostridium josui]
MEVGSINSKNVFDTAKSTSSKVSEDSFEKRLREAADKGDDSELKEVCHEFESLFISMLYKQMKATVPKSDYLGSDTASDIYNSMLDDQLCEVASKRGIGLGDMMYKQLSRKYKQEDSASVTGGVFDEKK